MTFFLGDAWFNTLKIDKHDTSTQKAAKSNILSSLVHKAYTTYLRSEIKSYQ